MEKGKGRSKVKKTSDDEDEEAEAHHLSEEDDEVTPAKSKKRQSATGTRTECVMWNLEPCKCCLVMQNQVTMKATRVRKTTL